MTPALPFILMVILATGTDIDAATFSEWRASQFPASELNKSSTESQGDYDQDGYSNAVEFAFGSNPIQNTSNLYSWTFSDSIFSTDFPLPSSPSVAVSMELSNDLINWVHGANYTLQTTPSPNRLRLADYTPLSSNKYRFRRLRIDLFEPTSYDTDADGLDDAFEQYTFGNLSNSGAQDSDQDGLSNYTEFIGIQVNEFALPDGDYSPVWLSLAPNLADSDQDGSNDAMELAMGTDPTEPPTVTALTSIGSSGRNFLEINANWNFFSNAPPTALIPKGRIRVTTGTRTNFMTWQPYMTFSPSGGTIHAKSVAVRLTSLTAFTPGTNTVRFELVHPSNVVRVDDGFFTFGNQTDLLDRIPASPTTLPGPHLLFPLPGSTGSKIYEFHPAHPEVRWQAPTVATNPGKLALQALPYRYNSSGFPISAMDIGVFLTSPNSIKLGYEAQPMFPPPPTPSPFVVNFWYRTYDLPIWKRWPAGGLSDPVEIQKWSFGGHMLGITSLQSGRATLTAELKSGNVIRRSSTTFVSDGVDIPIRFKSSAEDDISYFAVHERNLTTRLDSYPLGGIERAFHGSFSKVTCLLWQDGLLNLFVYLEGYNDEIIRSILEETVSWKVDGVARSDSYISLGAEPGDQEHRTHKVEVIDKKTGLTLDRLLITIVSMETKALFDEWYENESSVAGLAWLGELPAMPEFLQVNPLTAPDAAFPQRRYHDPEQVDTFLHPDARYELRSLDTAGGYGHQVCFDKNGGLILSSVSAGTADKSPPVSISHVTKDVYPYIRALQLDGNPCDRILDTLTVPMLYEGYHLKRYMKCRPTIPNTKLRFTPGAAHD
jgi:hypothetical protein